MSVLLPRLAACLLVAWLAGWGIAILLDLQGAATFLVGMVLGLAAQIIAVLWAESAR